MSRRRTASAAGAKNWEPRRCPLLVFPFLEFRLAIIVALLCKFLPGPVRFVLASSLEFELQPNELDDFKPDNNNSSNKSAYNSRLLRRRKRKPCKMQMTVHTHFLLSSFS